MANGDGLNVPDGLDEIMKKYGNPFPMSAVPAEWEKRHIIPLPLPPRLFTYLGQPMMLIRCNKVIQGNLTMATREMVRLGLGPIAYGGKSYNWEIVGEQLGVHSWGIAIHLGAPGEGPEERAAAIMVNFGFVINPNDPTHFQLATGYWVE